MYAGPNQLTDLFEVLVKFRGFEVGLMMDLSKAYQTLHLSGAGEENHS